MKDVRRTRLEEIRSCAGDDRQKSSRPQVRLTRQRAAIDKNVDAKSKVSVEEICELGHDALGIAATKLHHFRQHQGWMRINLHKFYAWFNGLVKTGKPTEP